MRSGRQDTALCLYPVCWNKLSIVAADRMARTLGTTLAEMFRELERER